VIGATADGWWRDRPAAARRLWGRLHAFRPVCGEALVLVLDVPQDDLPEGDHDGVGVVYATRRGRDAADDRIRELVASIDRPGTTVVTSDRALRADVEAAGATVVGAGTFLRRLDAAGC
jgi:predicted RNA-binding protein with PIN domain